MTSITPWDFTGGVLRAIRRGIARERAPEIASHPLFKSALAFATALSFQRAVASQYGLGCSAETFANKTLELLQHEVIRTHPEFSELAFASRPGLRVACRDTLIKQYRKYEADAPGAA